MDSLAALFTRAGGVFVSSSAEIAEKLARIEALVFDWDGVFNAGLKGGGLTSGFTETDSMGTNMLRYGLWRRSGQVPVTAIVSGENNDTPVQFARREHFHAVYRGVPDKRAAIDHLCAAHGIEPTQIASIFDDINDLAMARVGGLRCLVRNQASPLLRQYAIEHGLCDYVTGNNGSRHAVREIAEMLLGHLGLYDAVVDSRIAFDESYRQYFKQRQAGATAFYTHTDGVIASQYIRA